MKILACVFILLTACGTPQAEHAETDAACAATRSLYKSTRQKLWTGPCKSYDVATECPAYIALRETFILQLEKLQCPTEP